jgi:hypothetical protein
MWVPRQNLLCITGSNRLTPPFCFWLVVMVKSSVRRNDCPHSKSLYYSWKQWKLTHHQIIVQSIEFQLGGHTCQTLKHSQIYNALSVIAAKQKNHKKGECHEHEKIKLGFFFLIRANVSSAFVNRAQTIQTPAMLFVQYVTKVNPRIFWLAQAIP